MTELSSPSWSDVKKVLRRSKYSRKYHSHKSYLNSIWHALRILNLRLCPARPQRVGEEIRAERCVEKVIGEFHKAPASPDPAPVAAATAPSDSGLDDPMESPMSPVAEPAPMVEIHAVRHVTSAEYQTRLLEFKVDT